MINAHLKPVRQRIYNGCTNAVQTAGYLVPSAAELSACVQHRKDNLNGRKARLMIDADRNTTAVVDDGDGVVRVNRNVNIFAVSCQCLVYRVVDNLIDQMVKSPCGGTADIHTWALPYGFQTLQNLNLVCTILCLFHVLCTHLDSSCFFVKHRSLDHLEYAVCLKMIFDKLVQSGTGNQCLYAVNALQKIILPATVQLRQNIIQQ